MGQPLHQQYPTFLKKEDIWMTHKRLKADYPSNEIDARALLKKLIKSCEKTTNKYKNNNNNLTEGDFIKISKGTSRILNLCSNVLPNEAHNNNQINTLLR